MRAFLRRLMWWRGSVSRARERLPVILGLDETPSEIEGASSGADVEQRLLSMPIMVREVYLLSAVDDLSLAEIATRLAIRRPVAEACLIEAITILMRAEEYEAPGSARRLP